MDMMAIRRRVLMGQKTDKNLFRKNFTRIDGKYMDNSGRETTTAISGYFAEYMKVSPNTMYSMTGETRFSIYYYDSSKTWLSKKGAANAPFVFTTPSTCEYIRLQYGLADLNVDSIRIVPYTS